MNTYAAPIAEMRFVIRELTDFALLRTLPGFEDAGSDLVDAVLAEAGRLGAEVLAPLNASGDREGCSLQDGAVRMPEGFADAWRRFVEGGWNSLPFPPEYGGQGLPQLLGTAVSEIWSAANMAFALCPLLTHTVAEFLVRHGDAFTRTHYLPKLVSGEWTGTMLLTEPQAGTDVGRVRTRASRDGSRYRISGQKIYITYGEHDMAENIVHAVLARTPDAPAGVRGLSLFLVPKVLVGADGRLGPRNDLRCVSIERKMGIHASPTAVMAFGDDAGAVGYLVGAENRGMELMFTMMNSARLAVGLNGIGIAERAYQQARAYAFDRVQGRRLGGDGPDGVPIVDHPDVQRMLLTMKSQTEAARAMAYSVAASLDIAARHPDAAVREARRARVDLLTPVVKAWSTDTGIDVANTAIQVHGGMGYIEESGVPQFLRDARIAAIYEGTNGIQAMDLVARKVAGDGGEAVRVLLDEIAAFDKVLAGESHPALRAVRARLRAAAGDLAAATEWLLATWPREPRRVAAGAVHYLRLLGNVVGGWLMARAALVARSALGEEGHGSAFLESKMITAHFFAESALADSPALRGRFTGAGDALDGFAADMHL